MAPIVASPLSERHIFFSSQSNQFEVRIHQTARTKRVLINSFIDSLITSGINGALVVNFEELRLNEAFVSKHPEVGGRRDSADILQGYQSPVVHRGWRRFFIQLRC